MADYIQPTPRNKLLGLLADGVQGVNDFASAPFGYGNPPGQMLMQMLGLPDIAKTADRMSYGESLTTGSGMTTKPRPEVMDGLMAAAPMAAGAGLLAAKAAPTVQRGLMAGMENLAVPNTLNKQAGMLQWHGPNPKNDMGAKPLQNLVSSQRYLDRDIVANKIREGKFDVQVTPEFELDGSKVRAIQDGHHALEAAIRSGNKPNFIENTVRSDDRIQLLKDGNIDDFLEAAYHDAPWYNFATKRDVF